MTTRVLVTNFGPEVVYAGAQDQPLDKLFPQQYKEFYVWHGHVIIVREDQPKVEDGVAR